ncbi:MAG: hypothetical protein ABI602_01675 [Candidatus Saccharibacteria bacterium]
MTIAAEQNAELHVNPYVSAEIFENHLEAAFWIGRVATTDSKHYDALAQFRANVYVGQMGFLGPEDIDIMGRELDADDARSVHFGAVENTTNNGIREARIVASGRLIVKDCVEGLLPIETSFPELFSEVPAPIGSVEVSRFISRHENQIVQHSLALAMIRAMSLYSADKGMTAGYCMIEKPLLNLLSHMGLPLEKLGEQKTTLEPGGLCELHPIRINPQIIIETVTNDAHDKLVLREFFKNDVPNGGEGFYPASLVGGYSE